MSEEQVKQSLVEFNKDGLVEFRDHNELAKAASLLISLKVAPDHFKGDQKAVMAAMEEFREEFGGDGLEAPAPDDLPENYRSTLIRVSGSIKRDADYAMFWMGVNDGWAKKSKPLYFPNDYYNDGLNFAIKFRKEIETKK